MFVEPAAIEIGHDSSRQHIQVTGHVEVRARGRYETSSTVSCGVPGHDRAGYEVVGVMPVTVGLATLNRRPIPTEARTNRHSGLGSVPRENIAVTATTASLWTAARRDLAMLFSYVDGAELLLRGSAFIGLTGGPAADFNMALFDEDPDDLAVFDEFVSRVKATRLSALAMLSSAARRRLGPVAKAKGLIEAGTAPLMTRSGALPDAAMSELSSNELVKRGKCRPSVTSQRPRLAWIGRGLIAHSPRHRCSTHRHWLSILRIEETCQ